jgi:2-polyprenyl-3-methyl-5-hydroxy-6-metoxy-1,4-benzoquinol methylase
MEKPWFDKYIKNYRRTKKEYDNVTKELWYHSYSFLDGTSIQGTYDLRDSIEEYFKDIVLDQKLVLDVGCADGFLSVAAALRGSIVTSLDAAPFYLRHAKFAAKKQGVELTFFERDLFQDNDDMGLFDIVFCNHVLCHINPDIGSDDLVVSKLSAIKKLKTFMKKNGTLVIVDNNENIHKLLLREFDVNTSKISFLSSTRYVCTSK